MKKIVVVIDGQGGRIGSLLVEKILQWGGPCEITAVGTNSAATTAMVKAGAHVGATGENPVLVNCRRADVVLGPIGVLAADALAGEITPAMAVAVGQCGALKILLPVNRCNHFVVGVKEQPVSEMIDEAVLQLKRHLAGQEGAER